jgi:glycerophosphoryl diester phosphodiesterase
VSGGCDAARRRLLIGSVAGLAAGPMRSQPRWPYPTLDGGLPLVIAHRGASGHRPEHTLAAYELAIAQGADFIEPDLVLTRDGALVARHENELSLTTDVASRPQFAGRRRTQTIDGRGVSGWFSEDFTLEEIRSLRAGAAGSRVGIYPELKYASHFAALGLAPEKRLAEALKAARGLPVYVQSFDWGALRRFARFSDAPRVMLLARPPSAGELRELAAEVQGIGVAKALVHPRGADGEIGSPTSLIGDAHALGLVVHAWTFRNEDAFLPANLRGRPQRELEIFFEAGVDGVFADHPDTAIATRSALRR